MIQQTLFSTTPPFVRSSATSRQAASAVQSRTEAMRQAVLGFLRRCGADGATRQELEDALAMSGNCLRPRVRELIEKGLIEETERTRPAPSGRAAFVLLATGSA